MGQDDSKIIDASPTKDFFITMLVRDIDLVDAIADLVDNCIDGARRLRGNERYYGLTVRIEANPERFKIEDNCGGIAVDIARNYAFRFGRPPGAPKVEHSVGQFGVGMKRALFKLGRKFRVESKAPNSSFTIDEDVEEWKEKQEWQFEFKELRENEETPQNELGTSITVTSLHESIVEYFKLENFQNRLRESLSLAHKQSMEQGLEITLNGTPIHPRLDQLLDSDFIHVMRGEETYEEPQAPPVTVTLYAGLSESDPNTAGWYVYCNGRAILEADQTITTGWGENRETTIPKYHNQFARFRGYAFFDCADAGRLPWNTTKNGVDADSPIFRATRLKMINTMRPVIDFLNKLDAEKDAEESPLLEAVEAAPLVKLSEVRPAEKVETITISSMPPKPRQGNIQYRKPLSEINSVKDVLRVFTLKEVGEKTFEYFLERECED